MKGGRAAGGGPPLPTLSRAGERGKRGKGKGNSPSPTLGRGKKGAKAGVTPVCGRQLRPGGNVMATVAIDHIAMPTANAEALLAEWRDGRSVEGRAGRRRRPPSPCPLPRWGEGKKGQRQGQFPLTLTLPSPALGRGKKGQRQGQFPLTLPSPALGRGEGKRGKGKGNSPSPYPLPRWGEGKRGKGKGNSPSPYPLPRWGEGLKRFRRIGS